LTTTTSLAYAFRDVASLDFDVSGWDVSNITNMRGMFLGCSGFSGTGLAAWDVGNAESMRVMFYGTENFYADLSGWDVDSVESWAFIFEKTSQKMKDNLDYWPEKLRPFISVWRFEDGDDLTISLPLVANGEYDFSVDWGDGSLFNNFWGTPQHTYEQPGEYTIRITGKIKGWSFFDETVDPNDDEADPLHPDRHNIILIANWGSLEIGDSEYPFAGCTNLRDIPAPDRPLLL
jgi:surface protein